MITIQRLNMDSSWKVKMHGTTFLVDPWLVGSEIDGFKWLNEQWHTTDPVKPEEVGHYDFILITQSYDDHCHRETLERLDDAKPILATRKAYSRLRKQFPKREIHLIDHKSDGLPWHGMHFVAFRPAKLVDPIYFAVAILSPEEESIFYAPHGFALSQKQLEKLAGHDATLLITTFTDFRLPAILGGHVNPGQENAAVLCQQIKARSVVNTHDEPKKMQGLVADYAKVRYPEYDKLVAESGIPFIHIDDYSPVEI